jgi:hypothetical protein
MALGVGAALMTAFVGIVNAGTQGADCPGDASKVRLYENGIGDTSDNDDRLWRCTEVANLIGIDHIPGTCKGFLIGQTTWNDCVSSYQIWIPDGWHFVLYRDNNYNNWSECRIGPIVGLRFNVASNDTLTSLRWIPGETCP